MARNGFEQHWEGIPGAMTNPFDNPNDSDTFAPLDADSTVEALTEAIVFDDDNWIRNLGVAGSL